LGFQVILHYPLLYSVLIHKILLVAYADTLEARALDALGTFAAIAVVKTGLPSRSLRGDIVISIIRSRVAYANTILARGAGQLAVSVEHTGEGRS
jgi:hypothetical protein